MLLVERLRADSRDHSALTVVLGDDYVRNLGAVVFTYVYGAVLVCYKGEFGGRSGLGARAPYAAAARVAVIYRRDGLGLCGLMADGALLILGAFGIAGGILFDSPGLCGCVLLFLYGCALGGDNRGAEGAIGNEVIRALGIAGGVDEVFYCGLGRRCVGLLFYGNGCNRDRGITFRAVYYGIVRALGIAGRVGEVFYYGLGRRCVGGKLGDLSFLKHALAPSALELLLAYLLTGSGKRGNPFCSLVSAHVLNRTCGFYGCYETIVGDRAVRFVAYNAVRLDYERHGVGTSAAEQ